MNPTWNLVTSWDARSRTVLAIVESTFVYDQDNKMTAIVHPDMTRTTYTYGADGLRRLTLTPSGAVTTVIYDGSDYLKEEK
ncbi:hypothetical protein CCB80_10255 [Armatimonadetes bacterium Uphvl-Ar1]|nr:hypothetical protein CCB80_10255 [Armatimonadetes bacterium Uphvl-Ar1]